MFQQTSLNRHTVNIPNGPLSIEVEYKTKSSYPLVKSTSPEGSIGEQIAPPIYSDEQHQTWSLLLHKHSRLVEADQYLCPEYKEGLHQLNVSKNYVSHLNVLSDILKNTTSWQVIRVEGLVGTENFFKLLANKLFPCTDFIRHRDEINYTPAPDTFHDQIGHLPMIMHQRFADFFHLFGVAGTKVQNAEQLEWFNRIYWFTVEFGLINPTIDSLKYDSKQSLIYGAGIASSCSEIVYCLSSAVIREPFNLEVIVNTPFNIHHMQERLFEISSFDALEHSFRTWAVQHGFLSSEILSS